VTVAVPETLDQESQAEKQPSQSATALMVVAGYPSEPPPHMKRYGLFRVSLTA